MKKRIIGVEYLRIIAIILVIVSHSVPFYGDTSSSRYIDLNLATTSVSSFILIVFRYCGQIGNCIFVVISSYFLVDSKNLKWKKVASIVIESFVFSSVICVLFLFTDFDIGLKTIIQQFFPITFQCLWYVGCYLLLYLIHPSLNIVINHSSKKQLLEITLALFFLYSLVSTFIGGGYYYNYLIGFIMIYFVIAYMKIYVENAMINIKINTIISLACVVFLLLLLFATNAVGLRCDFANAWMLKWNIFSNPLIIMLSISLFNLFYCYEFKKHVFLEKISQLTLYIYMIHENQLIRDYLKPAYYNWCNLDLLSSSLLLIIVTLFSCILLCGFYKKFIQPLLLKFLIEPACIRFKNIVNSLENTILNL